MAQDGVTAGGASYTLDNVTFPVGRNKLQSIFDAIRSTNKGNNPPDLVAGQFWLDDNTPSTTVWTLYFYDGENSIQFATIDTINNTVNFIDSTFDLINDTTPQLGGDLDLNSNDITGTGNINITGNITASGNLAGTLTTASQPNITSVGTLTSATVSGDLTVDTGTLKVDSTNNRVGIGISSPSSLLHIKGANPEHRIEDNNETGSGNIIFRDSVRETAKISVASGASATYQINMLTTPAFRIDSNNDINFFEDTGTTPKLFWDASAERLSLGNSNPSDTLHIDSGGIRIYDNTDGNGGVLAFGTSAGYQTISGGTGSNNMYYRSYARHIWKTATGASSTTDGTERMRIDSSGNVGIGSTSPSSSLHIQRNTTSGTQSLYPSIHLENQSTGTSYAYLQMETNNGATDGGLLAYVDHHEVRTNQYLTFRTGASSTERMRIDSSGNVGIGTSSPSCELHVNKDLGYFKADVVASSEPARLQIGYSTDGSEIYTTNFGGNLILNADYPNNKASSFIGFNTDNNEKMRITSDGLVGIGTSSPASKLHIDGSGLALRLDGTANTSRGIILRNTGTAEGQIQTDGNMHFIQEDAGRVMKFSTANTERMRIDSSGNVLVGTTSFNYNASGVAFRSGDYSYLTRDSGYPLLLNRKTNDGVLLNFYRDNTEVGNISTRSNNLSIGSVDTGLEFNQANDIIFPANPSTNNTRDNAIDLGSGAVRFKNLYLSGSVYLGGTGSANALDDYEEGTFTPLVEGTTTSGSATYTTRVAKYTKVGNIVHFNIFIIWTGGTGTGPIIITGLPFTSVGSSYHSAVTIGWMDKYDYTNGKIPRAYISASASRVSFEESTDNGTSATLTYDSEAGFILSGSYETT